jgi:mono/diheme cytochrome c family protein
MSSSSTPNPNSRPDLDDTINVTTAHNSASMTAAAARENRNPGSNKEPLSIATFAVCAVIFIICGSVIGNASGGFFSYNTTIKPEYVRGKAPGVADDVALPPKPILNVYVKKGQSLYSAKCNGCHGADGKGDGANYPSLVGSAWSTGHTERFSQVILNGLQGPTSTGKVYGAGVMPAQGSGMSAQDLAFIMTFIRNSFGNSVGDVVTPEMAQAAIDIAAKRSNPAAPVTAEELKAHEKDLAGEKMDPATLVDPITFQPVEAKK